MSQLNRKYLAIVLLALPLHPVFAQSPLPAPVRAALETLRRDNAWTIDTQQSLCGIPAPTFHEQRRGEEYQRRFRALGLEARIDSVGNVIAERPGRRRRPLVVLSAHLDTVFPEGTDLTVRESGDTLYSPGIGDDCRGLAILLAMARAMNSTEVVTDGTILFAGTVGEEGLGNLRGVRHLFERELRDEVDYFVTVDLEGSRLATRATGSLRYAVSFTGPGGHSFEAFGMPNPVHAAGRAIAAIGDLTVPQAPKTTFNVGVVHGGTSVNAIADSVTFHLDLRSESPSALARLDSAVKTIVDQALQQERNRWPGSTVPLRAAMVSIGNRPAGTIPDSAFILLSAIESARHVGLTPEFGTASTDANLPLSLGIPAIAMGGGGSSGGAHSPGEWYIDGPEGWKGPQWVLLLATRLTGLP